MFRKEETLMRSILIFLILVSSVLFGGCGRSGRGPQVTAMNKESPVVIKIENFEVTDKTLTIDYRVRNNFDGGIWVCYDTWVHGERGTQDTTTRIDDKTVHIKLYFNMPRRGFVNPPPVAKYVRLLPGETFSGRIVEDLPIRDYSREWQAKHKEHRDIVLYRATFEIGYFSPKWNEYFTKVAKWSKEEPDEDKPIISGPFYYLSLDPFITEELLGGKLREVFYIGYASIQTAEESAQVLITNADIPCSVVVDE